MMRMTSTFLALSIVMVPVAANAGDGCKAIPVSTRSDIVDTAVGAGQFGTLVAAVKGAGLVEALKGEGPFTVFAPTDEAFAKLPEGTIESLLKPENKSKLASILTYHVISGKYAAKDVLGMMGAVTLNGQRVRFSKSDSGVRVDDAQIIKTDIACDNGIIHVIDQVILPSTDTIVETADKAGHFATLLAAAKAAGLAKVLQGDGPYTVFAPTDAAFGRLPKGTVESLLKPENRDQLAAILKLHVVEGRVYSNDAVRAAKAATLNGEEIQIRQASGKIMVQSASVITPDLDASNGVIHVIDQVILPEEATTRSKSM